MKIGVFIKNKALAGKPGLEELFAKLSEAGYELYRIDDRGDLQKDTELLLSVGGDGTFLSASKLVADSGVPVLGVNMGRLGFLSENKPEDVAEALLSKEYTVENRSMLHASLKEGCLCEDCDFWPYALNEVTVHRSGAAVLGIKVDVDGSRLPTYWADGLLVATASGSTAYSLSVGGPICLPDAKVLVIAPIAPHNLNVRPLVVPDSSTVNIAIESRDKSAVLTMDNRTILTGSFCSLSISMAQFSLKRIRLPKSSFVKALTSKLFWGEDIRNNEE